MLHTSIFGSTLLTGTIPTTLTPSMTVGAPAYSALVPPIDGYFSAAGTNALLVPKDLKVVAAYAADSNPFSTGVLGFGLARTRLNSPSLLRTAYPFIMPMQSPAASSNAGYPNLQTVLPRTPDPSLAVLLDNPIQLKCSEPLMIEMASAAAVNTDNGVAVLWFCDEITPIPSGAKLDAFWIHYIVTAPASLAPGAWIPSSIQFDQNLPQGAYAVIGFSHFGPSALAARLSFPGSPFKPGTLAQNGNGVAAVGSGGAARTHRVFTEGDLGILGTFQTFALPSVEIVVAVNTDSPVLHEGFLRVIRLGDCSCI